jgi:hypothetical protein
MEPGPPRPTAPRPSPRQAPLPLRALRVVVEVILAALILLDELVRPLYRPLERWIASLRLVARMEAAIARMPRLAVLVLLALPLAVAEPLKIVGLVLVGRGQFALGVVVLGLAYLASFLIVERIYHAGRAQLLSYGWLAWSDGPSRAPARRTAGLGQIQRRLALRAGAARGGQALVAQPARLMP